MDLISTPYSTFKLTSFIKYFQQYFILEKNDMSKRGSRSLSIFLAIGLV